jgi:uncharacterized protein DUF4440
MKAKSAIVAVLALAVGALGQRERKDLGLQAQLIATEKQSWEAWQKRDGKFYENSLSDDHVEVGGSGRSTKKEVVDFVGSPVCVVKSYAVREFELTKFNDNTALLTYHAEQDTTCHGKQVTSPVWVSSLYVRRSGRWVNALYQQTNKP